MTIHFNADLRPVVGKQVGMLHWIMDPEVSGFIIAYDLDRNQVLICNFDVGGVLNCYLFPLTALKSEKHPVDSWDEQHCRKVVQTAIGCSIPFDILSWRPWVLSRKIAETYNAGNVFL